MRAIIPLASNHGGHMAQPISAYATGRDVPSGYIEVKVMQRSGRSPGVTIDNAGDMGFAFDGNSNPIVLMPLNEARLLKQAGTVDF